MSSVATPFSDLSSAQRNARLSSALAVLAATAAAVALLASGPLDDAFFTAWVLFGVTLAVVGAVGAWTNRTPLVWVAALVFAGLTILGLLSIGVFFAPAAFLLLVSAAFSQRAGPRAGVRESILSDPPARSELGLKGLGGAGAMAVGAWLVSRGAFARDLFGACARETLDCALAVANWMGIGLTLAGLVVIGFGCWLVWTQAYVVRVLASSCNE
jgi:hypothetical protein